MTISPMTIHILRNALTPKPFAVDQPEWDEMLRIIFTALEQPAEPAADYRIPFPLMDAIYETLKFYANTCSYQGERIGGVLQGCPRGPTPTAAQLVVHAEHLLERVNREVLGRLPPTKEPKHEG